MSGMNASTEDAMFKAEFLAFTRIWESTRSVYDPAINILLGVGLVGNAAALGILCLTREMRSPTFAYHAALLTSYLVFCATYFALAAANAASLTSYTVTHRDGSQQSLEAHVHWAAAVFTTIIYPSLNTATGFMILYMVSAICVDRVIAFFAIKRYMDFNQWPVCRWGIGIALVLSVGLHSWAPWFTHQIIPIYLNKNMSLYMAQLRNEPSRTLAAALQVSTVVNGGAKVAYPLLILALTVASILGSKRRREFRDRCLSTASRRRQSHRDFTAFGLMIGVVVLAFIQVIPSEAKRLLEVIRPIPNLTQTFLDTELPMDQRLRAFRILLYGYEWAKLIANLCTAIERSAAAYLYIFLNQMFRRQLWRLLRWLKHGRCEGRRRRRPPSLLPPPTSRPTQTQIKSWNPDETPSIASHPHHLNAFFPLLQDEEAL